jgi:hypothetical protein
MIKICVNNKEEFDKIVEIWTEEGCVKNFMINHFSRCFDLYRKTNIFLIKQTLEFGIKQITASTNRTFPNPKEREQGVISSDKYLLYKDIYKLE